MKWRHKQCIHKLSFIVNVCPAGVGTRESSPWGHINYWVSFLPSALLSADQTLCDHNAGWTVCAALWLIVYCLMDFNAYLWAPPCTLKCICLLNSASSILQCNANVWTMDTMWLWFMLCVMSANIWNYNNLSIYTRQM